MQNDREQEECGQRRSLRCPYALARLPLPSQIRVEPGQTWRQNIIAPGVGEQPGFIRPGDFRGGQVLAGSRCKGPLSFPQTSPSPSLALVDLNFVFCAADENQT